MMIQEEKQPFLIVVADDALTPAKITEGLADRSVVKIEFRHEDGSISSGYVFGNGTPMREINNRMIAEQEMRKCIERSMRHSLYSEHDRIMQSANTEMSFPKLFTEPTDKPVGS